jgi:hypothetical protein
VVQFHWLVNPFWQLNKRNIWYDRKDRNWYSHNFILLQSLLDLKFYLIPEYKAGFKRQQSSKTIFLSAGIHNMFWSNLFKWCMKKVCNVDFKTDNLLVLCLFCFEVEIYKLKRHFLLNYDKLDYWMIRK